MTAPNLLGAIVAATRSAVAERQRAVPAGAIERAAARCAPRGALFRQRLGDINAINVIAECKHRSPSRGVLRPEYDPAAIARAYAGAGAAAISVLTEPAFFGGTLEHLTDVREAVDLPLLRKDFILEEYQLVEARLAGADAVLLIVAALDDVALRSLLGAARNLELATLVEVHDRAELERALTAGADVVGVNNRNLRTLDVDLDRSAHLIELMPATVTAVAESGLRTGHDIATLRRAGYRAFLIGESLMTRPDPGQGLRRLREAALVEDPTG